MIDRADLFSKSFERLIQAELDERAEISRDIAAVIELEILDRSTPEARETWHVEIRSGRALLDRGAHGHPNVLIEMERGDWEKLLSGALRPRAAFIEGRLSIAGDVGLGALLLPIALGVLDRTRDLERR